MTAFSIVIAGSLIVFAKGITLFSPSDSDSLDSQYLARFETLSAEEDLRFVFFKTVWALLCDVPGGSWGSCSSWLWGESTPESWESGCEDMLEYWDCGWDPEMLPVWSRFCLRLGLGGKKFLRTWNNEIKLLK